jgi:hypothetical protein
MAKKARDLWLIGSTSGRGGQFETRRRKRSDDYGSCNYVYKRYEMNLSKIARAHEGEDKIIKEFSDTVCHELVHSCIQKAVGVGGWKDVVEEKYVRLLTGEPFGRATKLLYKE